MTEPRKNGKRLSPEHFPALYGKLRDALNPDNPNGVFALPPSNYQLRQELAVLPLQYDSEGKLLLPPKVPGRAKATGQTSLRQLLGRSPDRADSLVLAIYALNRRSARPNYGAVDVNKLGPNSEFTAKLEKKAAEMLAKWRALGR